MSLQGVVRGEGELCPAVRHADGSFAPGPCRTVRIAYDTGAPRSVFHPRVAPRSSFPLGPTEAVRGVGRGQYPTTVGFLKTPGCAQAGVLAWVAADPADALGVDVIVGDDYMEVAGVIVAPQVHSASCLP